MTTIKPIRTDADYAAALTRIDELMDAEADSAEGEELDILTDLVEHYEAKTESIGFPNPIAAIAFRMEQAGLTPRDLAPFMGGRAKVSEVLSGKRPLTMAMARALHEHLGIPAAALLREPRASFRDPLENLDWRRFPIKAMHSLGWFPSARNPEARAKELMVDLIQRAGGAHVVEAALYRKSASARANAKTDAYALKAWCWKVLAEANAHPPSAAYKPGTISTEFLRQLAQFSWLDDGPRLAKEFLSKHGIALVIVPHLPRTYLDGAALKLADGTPIVGLTLRYDRIDNFWFCLLHELAHIGRHMDEDGEVLFVDDLSLRGTKGAEDPKERQADEWAEEALIPQAMWETSEVRRNPTPMAVVNLSKALQIHPAIVAGKVRYELKNYRLLSHFVGTGEVRRQFSLPA